MEKYICTVCDYVYDPELGDPENGIEPGASFEDLPEDWVCLHSPHSRQAFHILQ